MTQIMPSQPIFISRASDNALSSPLMCHKDAKGSCLRGYETHRDVNQLQY